MASTISAVGYVRQIKTNKKEGFINEWPFKYQLAGFYHRVKYLSIIIHMYLCVPLHIMYITENFMPLQKYGQRAKKICISSYRSEILLYFQYYNNQWRLLVLNPQSKQLSKLLGKTVFTFACTDLLYMDLFHTALNLMPVTISAKWVLNMNT